MSGIAGIIHFDGRPVEPGQIEAMTGAMHYRGPDGINHWRKGNVALGQCMLRTTPESLEETQPLTNEDESLVLVMDGRVDNWEELRRELLGKGAVLRTRADAELVLRAYEVWGRDCLSHIDGDFALVIWDARRQEVFCARDRVGNKPLNYHWDGENFYFGSDLHSLFSLKCIEKLPNDYVLAEYLSGEFITREETFWRTIFRLQPACCLSIRLNGLESRHYWIPDFHEDIKFRNQVEYQELYKEILFKSVARQSRSHSPTAFEVSGGLDSSAIYAVAKNLFDRKKLITPNIYGFTLYYPDDSDANEIEYSRAVGNHLGVHLHEIQPPGTPFSWYQEWVEKFCDVPPYPNGAMALKLRQAAVNRGCRVVMTGVGGDEWLGMPVRGSYYSDAIVDYNFRDFIKYFVSDVRDRSILFALWECVRYGMMPLLPENVKYISRLFRGVRSNPDSWISDKLADLIALRKKGASVDLPKFKRQTQNYQYKNLMDPYSAYARESENRLAATIGVELRSPFNSRDMIQFAFSVPEFYRSRGGQTKWLHRKVMCDLLPKKIVERRTKADFMGVFRLEMKKLGGKHLENVIEDRSDKWINPKEGRATFDRYTAGEGQGAIEWQLWTLLAVDLIFPRTGA